MLFFYDWFFIRPDPEVLNETDPDVSGSATLVIIISLLWLLMSMFVLQLLNHGRNLLFLIIVVKLIKKELFRN